MAPENIGQKPKVSFLLPNDPHQRSEDVLSDLDFSCTYQISRQASQPHNKQILQPCCLVNWSCLSAFATLLTAGTEYLTGAASGRKEGFVLVHDWKAQPVMVEMWQEHTASTVTGRHGHCANKACFFLFSPRLQPRDCCCPHLRYVSLLS